MILYSSDGRQADVLASQSCLSVASEGQEKAQRAGGTVERTADPDTQLVLVEQHDGDHRLGIVARAANGLEGDLFGPAVVVAYS